LLVGFCLYCFLPPFYPFDFCLNWAFLRYLSRTYSKTPAFEDEDLRPALFLLSVPLLSIILSNSSSPICSPPFYEILFLSFSIFFKFSRFSKCLERILWSFKALWSFLFSYFVLFSSKVLILVCCLSKRCLIFAMCESDFSISARKSSGRAIGTLDWMRKRIPYITLSRVAL